MRRVSLAFLMALHSAIALGQASPPTPAELRAAHDRDPYLNGMHALRDKEHDPGDGWGPNDPRAAGAPVKQSTVDWPWGELFFGKTYPVELELINHCDSYQQTSLFVTDLPYLNIQRFVGIPAKTTIKLKGTITTPRAPDVSGPAGAMMPPGYFIQIQGRVVVWHALDPLEPCLPSREVYNAAGHVHFDPNPPPADGPPSPEKIGGATACQVWWLTGQPPAKATEEACTHEIEMAATEYRSRVLQPLADREPAKWTWLPAPEKISGMKISELLEMKTHAQTIIQAR